MRKLVQSFFILVALSVTAFAQERKVTGTVTSNEDGSAIAGVTVKVKEVPNLGTTTTADGKFSLSVPTNAKKLTFSFLGFTTTEVTITSTNVVNVSLKNDAQTLGEVVVTGVGVATSKKLVPIEVSTLSSKDFPKSATTNINQALQGQIAGAQVIQRSGTPGAGAQIILRGFTNLSGTTPLIMIDGIQVQSDLLTDLDPNIVDRIEVVKGSAGGMLYGAQGGNGVIQIFTKKGAKNSKLTIDFSSKYSNDRIIALNDLLATKHHWVTDAAGNILDANSKPIERNPLTGVWNNPTVMPFTIDKTVKNDKTINLPTFDHVQQGNRVANTYANSLNIRGGAERYDYAFGTSYLSQQDVFSNNYSRLNMNLNFGINPVKGLNFRSATQLVSSYDDLLAGNRFNLVNSLQWIDFEWKDPSGRYVVKPSLLTDNNNSLSERDARTVYNKTPRIIQSFNLNYKFPKFLEFDAKYSLDGRAYEGQSHTFNQVGRTQALFWGGNIDGSINRNMQNFRVHYGSASAYLRTDFKDDFNLNIPLKTTTQFTYDARQTKSESFSLTGTGLPAFPPYTITSAGTKSGSDSYSESLVYGFLVNQTFDYDNLFGVSAGFRSDYSSAFGGQGKAATFPRGTVYFNPSEFFKNKSVITNWKLRAAYGEAGVQPGIYDRQVTFDRGSYGESGSYLSTRTTARNPDLRIQTTTELEVGTDLNLTPSKGNWFSDLVLNATYWKRTSEDVLQNAPVAPSTGGGATIDNLVGLKGDGLDLSLDMTTYKSENFNWNLGVRWAKTKTSVTYVSNNIPITNGVFYLAPGGDLGALYMQRPLTSIDQLKPDGTRYIPEASAAGYTVASSGYVVNNANYNVVLTAANDLALVGNVNPDFTASFINRFTIFKKFTVSAQLDWIKGVNTYNQTKQWLYRDRLSTDFDKPVNIGGQEGAFVAYYNSLYNTNTPLSHFVEDGSYVRLRDLSVTYDLTNVLKQKWVRNISVTATGRNLATWTKYKGLDPETNSALTNQGGTITGLGSFTGVDYYGAPNLKSFQFSINVGF